MVKFDPNKKQSWDPNFWKSNKNQNYYIQKYLCKYHFVVKGQNWVKWPRLPEFQQSLSAKRCFGLECETQTNVAACISRPHHQSENSSQGVHSVQHNILQCAFCSHFYPVQWCALLRGTWLWTLTVNMFLILLHSHKKTPQEPKSVQPNTSLLSIMYAYNTYFRDAKSKLQIAIASLLCELALPC